MRKRLVKIAATLSAIIVALAAAGWLGFQSRFPYGPSHCCIIAMSMALEHYAVENNGFYPVGESSPEASLSLLYRSKYVDANTMRGMTVPEEAVRGILENDGLLGPESCGWHYVEGLTRADNPRLAILYCKEALGHNGQRTDGGRQVVFVGGMIESVAGDRWGGFLAEQGKWLAQRSESEKKGTPLVVATIELPDGSQIETVDGPYTLAEEQHSSALSSNGTQSGSGLSRSSLIWHRAPVQVGTITRTLSFSNLVSEAVTVEFVDGLPDRASVVFRMRVRDAPHAEAPGSSDDPQGGQTN
ncbi:MAG TPA: hypothetical protein VG125_03305 [Pirellulales bacterium]|jgi:hypothetical protein|nr:hypothetical protein [Pirellulales bacterium]